MKYRTAKEFLRPKAIEHYIKKKRSDLFVFMSLYSDKEPYPIEDLAEVQKSRVGVLKAEFDRLPTEFLSNELNFAEKMLKQIEQCANALGKLTI